MTPILSEEQRQALVSHPEQPLSVEDPATHTQFIILPGPVRADAAGGGVRYQ